MNLVLTSHRTYHAKLFLFKIEFSSIYFTYHVYRMPPTSGWRKAFVIVGIIAGIALIVAAIIIPVYLVPLLTGTTSMYASYLCYLRARRISLKYESCRRTTKIDELVFTKIRRKRISHVHLHAHVVVETHVLP